MSKVLVTGGAGFIGSHLAERLSSDHEVVVLDNLSGGYEENVASNIQLVVGDITNRTLVEGLFDENRFDYVFHLAAYAAEGLSHFIRRYNYENNVLGSINLINSSITHGIKKFVFTSSMGVYGTNQVPYDEEMKPAPEDPYGIAKYSIEQDLAAAKNMFDLDYVVFRPHNVYGTRQNIWDRYRNVVGIFMNQILNNQPMTIFGDGEQIRAFSHVDDIVPVLAKSIVEPSLSGEILNVGGEQPISINELAVLVARVMNKDLNVLHLPTRCEVKNAFSQHKKLQRLLGVYPSVALEDGLEEMALWAKENYSKRSHKDLFEFEQLRNLPSKWLNK